jgi:hypothetical protein
MDEEHLLYSSGIRQLSHSFEAELLFRRDSPGNLS